MPGIAEESQGRKATILSRKEFSSPEDEWAGEAGPSRITTWIADFESPDFRRESQGTEIHALSYVHRFTAVRHRFRRESS